MSMPWVADLRRRWSALLSWFRGLRGAPAAALALPQQAPQEVPEVGPARASEAPVAEPVTVVTPTPAPVVSAAVRAAAGRPTRVDRATPATTLDPALGRINVRQFFGRMVAATPAGLTIDFDEWQMASVERFFLAMTSPGLTRKREAPTSGVETVSLTNAFEGFEWD